MAPGLPASSNHKIDYVTQVLEILNFTGDHNRMIGSEITAILLEGEFILLLKLHREESAPAACAAGLFLFIGYIHF